jgi:hypothetical protein
VGATIATVSLVVAGALVLTGGPASAFSPTNGGAYYLRQDVADKCLDVVNAGTGDGTRLQRWQCGPQWNQQWVFTDPGYPTGVLSWRIRPRYQQTKCLDVRNGSSTPGAALQIWTCNPGWQQRFTIEPGFPWYQPDNFFVKTSYSNLCITVVGNGFDNGGVGQVLTCDRRAGENFTLWNPGV